MKLYTILASAFLSVSAYATPMQIPTHTSYLNPVFQTPDNIDSYWNLDTHLTWLREPTDGWGYYAMSHFRFNGGGSGYMGLMKAYDGKTAIFSMWDASSTSKTSPAHKNCKRFGTEGTGTQCFVKGFNWKAGIEYKMRLERTHDNQCSAFVVDVLTEEETLIGSINVDNVPGKIGFGGISPTGNLITNEYFMSVPNPTCENAPYFGVEWKGPYINDVTVKPKSWRSSRTNIGTSCPNLKLYAVKPYVNRMESGSGVVPTPEQEVPSVFEPVQLPYDLTYYEQLDCIFDWLEVRLGSELNNQHLYKTVSEYGQANEYGPYDPKGSYYRDYGYVYDDGVGAAIAISNYFYQFYLMKAGVTDRILGSFNIMKMKTKCEAGSPTAH